MDQKAIKWLTRRVNGFCIELIESWQEHFGELPQEQQSIFTGYIRRLSACLLVKGSMDEKLKPGIRKITHTFYLKEDGSIATKEEAVITHGTVT